MTSTHLGGRARRAAGVTAAAALLAGAAFAQDLPRTLDDEQLRALAPPPLATIPVPEPPDLHELVRDRQAAVALGKALFWEQRVGSQGQACASCHFQAGADPRSRNQLAPGLNGTDGFEPTASGGRGGPNYELTPADFPFHRKLDPTRDDRVPGNTLFDTNDVTSSMGAALADFVGIRHHRREGPVAVEVEAPDPVFNVRGINTRRVEPRNTPSVINAAFNHRNFWDGRANFVFNGVDPFGQRSNAARPEQGVWVREGCRPVKKPLELPFSSLASQAVGPPLSDLEMSSRGKTFPIIGRLLARHYALSLQRVHPEDSALARLRNPCRPGLKVPYFALIQRAFQPKYWASRAPIATPDGCYTQLELNFSLFFGLAVQLYEATLVSTRSRFDDFVAGDDDALTDAEKFGYEVFFTSGRCAICHAGPSFTDAVVPQVLGLPNTPQSLVLSFPAGPGVVIAADVGYINIGARRTTDDPGAGGADPFGVPLTFSAQLAGGPLGDRFLGVEPGSPSSPVPPGARVVIGGTFKVPGLRNVELTAPYMHHGGLLTLEQVVEFYARGGDFPAANAPDSNPLVSRLPVLVGQSARIAALAAFMRALTDPYVVDEKAPFDHPSLLVPNGLCGDEVAARPREELLRIPAVGKRGRKAYRLPPIRTFLQEHGPSR